MTPNEITTLIASSMDKQFDEPFKMQLMARVEYWRARLLRNTLEKNKKDRKYFTQPLYLKMRAVSDTPCGITGCTIMESISKVPDPIRANNITFDFVGAINSTNAFKETFPGTVEFDLQGTYTGKKPKFMLINNRIRVYNSKAPAIMVSGVYDNVQKVMELSCQTAACDYWNSEYPVTEDMLQLIVQMINEVDYGKAKETTPEQEIPVTKNQNR